MHWHWTDFKGMGGKMLGSPLTPEAKRRAFWDGFWSAFRHPVLIYGYGFAAGFSVRGLIA